MTTPLNLTLTRGPSVWDERRAWPSYWRVYGVAAGAALAAFAMQPRAKRGWMMGLAVGVAGTALLAGRWTAAMETSAHQFRRLRGTQKDYVVDRASEDSFPASDPPPYQ